MSPLNPDSNSNQNPFGQLNPGGPRESNVCQALSRLLTSIPGSLSQYLLSTAQQSTHVTERSPVLSREPFSPNVPQLLPRWVTFQELSHKFPNAIGPKFFQETIGQVDIVPIPRVFYEKARPGFQLVFIPEYITIKVDENSPLMLDPITTRLIEDPNNIGLPATGEMREIKVPVTPNNLLLITEKYLKKKFPSHFEDMFGDGWEDELDTNEDIRVGPSHWSYQKEEVIGLNLPYITQKNGEQSQSKLAKNNELETVPLVDRMLFHLARHLRSGNEKLETTVIERTSTSVIYNDEFWQSCIYPSSGLYFSRIMDRAAEPKIGLAVGMPDESGISRVIINSGPLS